jgi:hypothetical protein
MNERRLEDAMDGLQLQLHEDELNFGVWRWTLFSSQKRRASKEHYGTLK